jgi:general secretion pathway protein K
MSARQQRGTAVIMAMLIVAAAATLVSGAMWQQSALIRETENEIEYAQARWLIRGAIDWAGVILREDSRTSAVDHPGEPWAVPLADTRLNESDGRPPAYLAGAIEDEQAKFNLRNLVTGQDIEPRELKALGRLLGSLGISEGLAPRIAERVQAAVRATAAKQPALGLVAVDDLVAVQGLDAKALERLRPYLTVLPEATPVNANTASAEVLAAQFDDFSVLDARRVVAARERAFFKDLADARARLANAGVTDAANVPLAVATRYFGIEGNVAYGNARLRARALVKREGARLDVLWLRELG